MISLTAGPIFLITSESYEVKLRKSVRYATRSSREVLMSTGSTSCVKMTGHFGGPSSGVSEVAGEEWWWSCDECDGVVVRRESADELAGGVFEPAARPEYGQILTVGWKSMALVSC